MSGWWDGGEGGGDWLGVSVGSVLFADWVGGCGVTGAERRCEVWCAVAVVGVDAGVVVGCAGVGLAGVEGGEEVVVALSAG